MPHATMEYVIMAPILILQVVFFPLVTSWMMSFWIGSRRQIALRETADHLGSLIQQIYFSLNHENVPSGQVVYFPDLPKFIENYAYTVRGVLTSEGQNSSKVLKLNLTLRQVGNTVETLVVLGPNVVWNEATVYVSNSTNARILAEKFPNGTLSLAFGQGA
jgi:hypothetical protein